MSDVNVKRCFITGTSSPEHPIMVVGAANGEWVGYNDHLRALAEERSEIYEWFLNLLGIQSVHVPPERIRQWLAGVIKAQMEEEAERAKAKEGTDE